MENEKHFEISQIHTHSRRSLPQGPTLINTQRRHTDKELDNTISVIYPKSNAHSLFAASCPKCHSLELGNLPEIGELSGLKTTRRLRLHPTTEGLSTSTQPVSASIHSIPFHSILASCCSQA
ncbi:hypothetical protein LZ554_003638 [Drepanopeziza brunnea f. sp. 'monogermtubi']|nr:hypothetical protein LZ554_003638 [Drepanopeziza brunnea f. sp. 'monogermtubi']